MAIQDTDLLIAYRPADQAHYKLSFADLPGGDVIVSDTAPDPTNYSEGQLWWNSDSESASLFVLYNDPSGGAGGDTGGLKWVQASPTVIVDEDGNAIEVTGEYLKTDAAAGDQVVQSTGTTTFNGLTEHGGGVKVTGGTIDLTSANGEIAYGTDPLGVTNTLQIKGANTGQWLKFYDGGLQIVGDNNRAGASYGGLYADTKYQSDNTGCTTFVERCNYANVSGNTNKTGFSAIPAGLSFAPGDTGSYRGFDSNISIDTTSGNNLSYNFFARGTAPNFFAGDTYIGGTTTRNTRELWESTLTEEQKEQLAAGTLVVPANVAIPGDGEFARQWWYDQQDEETQALIDAGEFDYPEQFAAANFVDTFELGVTTNINLSSTGLGEFKGGVNVTGGKVSIGPDVADTRTHVLIGGASSLGGTNIAAIRVEEIYNRASSGGINGANTAFLALPKQTVLAAEWNTHFRAIGVSPDGVTVDNVAGFFADATLAAAGDTSYGFYSNIFSGDDGDFNFYAGGTSPNYFEGTCTSPSFFRTTQGIICQDVSDPNGNDWTINPLSSSTVGFVIRNDGTFLANLGSPSSVNTCASYRRDNDGKIMGFRNSSNTEIGNIRIEGGAIAGPGLSDYRTKSSIAALPSATAQISALNPVSFEYNHSPGYTHTGFIAHELEDYVPEAVFGTKDEEEAIGTLVDYDGTILETEVTEPEELEYIANVTDEDGVTTQELRIRRWTQTGTRPLYQGVDQTKLIPLLTKALQEALDKIEVLEQRLSDAGIA